MVADDWLGTTKKRRLPANKSITRLIGTVCVIHILVSSSVLSLWHESFHNAKDPDAFRLVYHDGTFAYRALSRQFESGGTGHCHQDDS